MDRVLSSMSLAAVLVGCATTPTAAAERPRLAPPAGRVLLIIGQDAETIDAYTEAMGRAPGGVMLYTSLQRLEGLSERASDGSGPMDGPHLLQRYPQACLQLGVYLVGALPGILTGHYDANIRRLAGWLRATQVPVFLRLGYEFDGPHNHYDPPQYQRAYRYVVDALRAHGVTNVSYVWHSYAGGGPRADLAPWYPGDAYVDWVGLSYFDQPEDYYAPVLQFARAHAKPVMIAEATPRGIGTGMGRLAWQAWFRPFFAFIQQHHIQVVAYINANWDAQPRWRDQGWDDARIQADAYVQDAWRREINQDTYLHASPELFTLLGYTPP